MFYPVFPKDFFRLYLPPNPRYKPPPSFISSPKTPYEIISTQGFNVGFYGSSELARYVQ